MIENNVQIRIQMMFLGFWIIFPEIAYAKYFA